MAGQGFWDHPTKAQDLMAELRKLSLDIKPLKEIVSDADDLQVLMEFADEDDSGSSEAELLQACEALVARLGKIELRAMMAQPEDGCNAFLSIQAGEGGTDASDWAAMLLRMYQRWAEDHGYHSEIVDLSEAEEAGIRSATLEIHGDYAFGTLKGEIGVHRLIRISPFDSAARRQTSFAAVDLTPELNDDVSIEVDWEQDVREDVFRSSGAGGQKVNKTSSAIRLTHLPTNTVVQCQNERSQHKNRALARKMLTAKLYQMEQHKRDAELAAKRGEKTKIGFGGGSIRTYTLQPQQQVKDHRTMEISTNPGRVLDGDIDSFIEAYLRWRIGHQA
jgi:peptide chain release factor 2